MSLSKKPSHFFCSFPGKKYSHPSQPTRTETKVKIPIDIEPILRDYPDRQEPHTPHSPQTPFFKANQISGRNKYVSAFAKLCPNLRPIAFKSLKIGSAIGFNFWTNFRMIAKMPRFPLIFNPPLIFSKLHRACFPSLVWFKFFFQTSRHKFAKNLLIFFYGVMATSWVKKKCGWWLVKRWLLGLLMIGERGVSNLLKVSPGWRHFLATFYKPQPPPLRTKNGGFQLVLI